MSARMEGGWKGKEGLPVMAHGLENGIVKLDGTWYQESAVGRLAGHFGLDIVVLEGSCTEGGSAGRN